VPWSAGTDRANFQRLLKFLICAMILGTTVCEPDYQSAEDLAACLHASRGSISMATRSLIRMGYVERHTKRGDRRTYYRIRPGTWTAIFEHLIQSITKMRQLAKQGLGLLNDEPATRQSRL
jgi:DNA-binding transcriptional regulator GbsR (MarR family)